jgi:hypothetical protein
MAIRHNEWQFDIFCGHLVYFPHFGMFGPRKTGNHVADIGTFLVKKIADPASRFSHLRCTVASFTQKVESF